MAESEVSRRVDWWRVITDLSCKGMTMEAISSSASVPLSTLAGYKNLNVEPKHADGERLLSLWRKKCAPAVPVITGSVRNRERSAG